MGQYGEIHYIGGTEVLPPPYSPEEEARMIDALINDESGEVHSDLVEHNLRLVVYIAKKFDNTGVGVEDLISLGTIGLIKAVDSFNQSKGIRLATYASRCIENELLMLMRSSKKQSRKNKNPFLSLVSEFKYQAKRNVWINIMGLNAAFNCMT